MNNSSVYPYIPNTAPETKKAMMERISAETERDILTLYLTDFCMMTLISQKQYLMSTPSKNIQSAF